MQATPPDSRIASRPMSRQGSKEPQARTYQSQSRRGSVQTQPLTRSPVFEHVSAEDSPESEAEETSKPLPGRRTNLTASRYRSLAGRKVVPAREVKKIEDEEEEDDEDALPFISATPKQPAPQQDPSATLRGGFGSTNHSQRSLTQRRGTMERITPTSTRPQPAVVPQIDVQNSSESSASTDPLPPPARPTHTSRPPSQDLRNVTNLPTRPLGPLSPRQEAQLAAAGLSPRRRSAKDGSDGTPSMGSSFSDLEDASVTRSALEEALASNMNNGNGMASRVSNISLAFKSRYFDAQGGR